MPNERLTAVLVASSTIQLIYMGVARSGAGLFHHFPLFANVHVGVDGIVTQFISVHVLSSRSNCITQDSFTRAININGRGVGFHYGEFIAAGRNGRPVQIL